MRSLPLARSQANGSVSMSRRLFLASTPFALAGCVQTVRQPALQAVAPPPVNPAYVSMYSAIDDEPFPIAAIDVSKIDPRYFRQRVPYATSEPAGTIIVDTSDRFLYLAQEDGHAMHYGIGVGKEGLAFAGEADMARKAEWPRWTPTQNMIEREPERYGPYAGGVPGGLVIRSAREPCIFTRMVATRSTEFTARTSRGASGARSQAAASGCSITTSSTCTAARRSARAWSSSTTEWPVRDSPSYLQRL